MKTFTRTLEIERAAGGFDCSLSSDQPVRMAHAPNGEILSHDPGAVDLSRCPLPLIVSHDRSDLPVGKIDSIRAEGGKLRGKIIFGASARAAEIKADVEAGIIRSLSIGYRVLEDQERSDGSVLVTRWQPYECSLVSVPADNSVGIGRSFDADRIREFADKNCTDAALTRQAIEQQWRFDRFERKAAELQRESDQREKQAMCERADVPAELQAELTKPDVTVEAARAAVMEIILERSAANNPGFRSTTQTDQLRDQQLREDFPMNSNSSPVGLTAAEIKNYSLARAFRAAATNDWRDAGFEREVSDAARKQFSRNTDNFVIPFEVLGQRDLVAGNFASAGATIGTTFGPFIDQLTIQAKVLEMGATVMTGLRGSLAMPRQTASTNAHWVVEGAEFIHSHQQFDQVVMAPQTLAARTNVTRRLMLQSSLSIEQIVRADLMRTIALELDRAAINGTGVAPEPRGILQTAGISVVAGGATGAAPSYLHLAQLVAALENRNAAEGNLGFLTNGKVKSKLLTTEKSEGSGVFVWESGANGAGSLCGYKALSSGNVPNSLTKSSASNLSAVIFGNWSSLLIGLWGPGIEIEFNPYQNFDTGEVGLRALVDADIAVRNPESFAVMTDAIA
ncbi:MAG: phage major capsid protein [Geobacter sp.]|nr:phage major capsid protein [Geobacter sp.]